ncbi:type IV pilus modification PilV family protein [Granulicatella seriolae]|uniref:Prepilin-type N-terminal cleavage/methylation domain-containing protein n=1 Tax=Granulicatella seriolae TaxID=2967226 RepID=A0ABT1WL26_9LACT|nr:prepilin-type N-terminal cleavage/methylation domain-containing protein [Granulicatella seriolae]
MKKQKGFTLTEVIISLIMLVIIVVGMLSFFSNGFSRIYFLRDRNIENFEIQADIEEKLADFKKNGSNGDVIANFTYKVGSSSQVPIKVKGTTLSHVTSGGYNINLFVANAKEIKLPIPEDMKIQVGDRDYYYLGETTASASYTLNYDSSVKLFLESGWFLSNRYIETNQEQKLVDVVTVGTILPKESILTDTSISPKTALPLNPTDFKKISGNQSGVLVTEAMLGRFLTFSARPISSRGRVGSYQEGQRLWIMGLPVLSGLRVHIDADLALQKITGEQKQMIPSDGQNYQNTDLKNYITGQELANKAIAVRRIYEPLIKQERQEIVVEGAQRLLFSNNDFSKGTTVGLLLTNQKQRGNILTLRFNENFLWTVALLDNGELQVDSVDYTIASNNNTQKFSTSINDNQDKTLISKVSAGTNSITVSLYLNDIIIYSRTLPTRYYSGRSTTTHNISNGQIEISGNTTINELAIYNKALTDNELSTLLNYFRNKYEFTAQ